MSKVLFICAEVSGSTKVYLFYFDVVFCWRCGPDQFFFFFCGGPLLLFNRKHECLFCCCRCGPHFGFYFCYFLKSFVGDVVFINFLGFVVVRVFAGQLKNKQ